MPDANGRYATDERWTYDPGPCPNCGGRLDQEWANNRKIMETEDWWLPTRQTCLNMRCDFNTGKAG